jgi:membrane associated rhomboid family serine protease
MLVIIPIRTESVIRRTPLVNYILLGVNVFLFLLLDQALSGEAIQSFKMRYLALHSDEPALYQFFTYQFLHADLWHLLGNMLFLWVFGNSVNAKMGDIPYLLFYLAGGVFAAWGYALDWSALPVPSPPSRRPTWPCFRGVGSPSWSGCSSSSISSSFRRWF